MESKIKIFDIELDKISPKEAMKRAMQYMEGESVSTIEIVTMEMLMQGQEKPEWKAQMLDMNLLLPGDREILESTERADWKGIRDLEDRVSETVFPVSGEEPEAFVLVADSEEDMEYLRAILARNAAKCVIAGAAVLPADSGKEENVINTINGEEPDCILSVLSSPWQEQFIAKGRALLNARLWLGCESILKWGKAKKRRVGKLRHFFLKKVFRYQVEKEKKL